MKVGIDARAVLGGRLRGEGKTLLQLYRHVALQQPDWQLVFFGVQAGPGMEELKAAIPGAQVVLFDLPGFRWGTWSHLGLPFHALWQGLDVLHGFSSGGPAWSPVPFVLTVHDVIPLLFDDGADAATVLRFRKNLAHGLRHARAVVAVSENTRQDLMRLFPATRFDRTHVVYWGAPEARVANASPMSAPAERVLVLGGGGAARKNMAGTLRMFAQVMRQRPSARLTVIGATDAAERARLTAQARALGLQDAVELCGFLPEGELNALYSGARCLVYLSLYEGFGLPPLEAMARGLPVVASNRSSVPEVVGEAGLLVDPEDELAAAQAVLALLEQPALSARLASAGYLQAGRFTWQRAATAMCELLTTAAASRSPD